jgi:hypothetical protein
MPRACVREGLAHQEHEGEAVDCLALVVAACYAALWRPSPNARTHVFADDDANQGADCRR